MDERNPNLKAALEGVDESKRSALKRLIGGGAFAAPIVASFAMGGLTVDKLAAASNTTASGRPFTIPDELPIRSDQRLKAGIERVGTHSAGIGLYRFRYLWSDIEHVGVMAQEVGEVMPHAVTRGEDGFLRVDYAAIGAEMVPYAAWMARTEAAAPAVAP